MFDIPFSNFEGMNRSSAAAINVNKIRKITPVSEEEERFYICNGKSKFTPP